MPALLSGHLPAQVFASRGINIAAQSYQTDGEIGYVVIDIDGGADEAQEIQADLLAVAGTIRARYLYDHP